LSAQPVPPAFAALTDLSADDTGTFVVYATDDYFAPKEALVRRAPPEWREGEYTERGKWMDGWESMRKREPGHDHAILRLGTPGDIHGILCDTTHFKGNAPVAVSLEACVAPHTATAADLHGADWREVLPKTEVQANFPNVLALSAASDRATHVRLHIYPDGGVARLRIYGVVRPEPRTFWQPASIDLVAIENGGAIAEVSDQFFGPPSNLLLPGRGVNMGDGWETKRRRTPGSDWCVLQLGRRGVVQRLEVDTHFFKGNAPQSVRVEARDGDGEWAELLEESPLVQHRRHVLEPARPRPVTQLRVHISPHGGVNRLRAFGHALDTPAEEARRSQLDAEVLRSFCGATAWVRAMDRPHESVRALFAAADQAFAGLAASDWLEAFAAHPRIGATAKAASATAQSAAWSSGEQAGVEDAVRAALAAGNDRYFDKFGFVFLVCATGRKGSEMLGLLEARCENSRERELANAAREQIRITRLRVEKWLLSSA
jgi:allantoicase